MQRWAAINVSQYWKRKSKICAKRITWSKVNWPALIVAAKRLSDANAKSKRDKSNCTAVQHRAHHTQHRMHKLRTPHELGLLNVLYRSPVCRWHNVTVVSVIGAKFDRERGRERGKQSSNEWNCCICKKRPISNEIENLPWKITQCNADFLE